MTLAVRRLSLACPPGRRLRYPQVVVDIIKTNAAAGLITLCRYESVQIVACADLELCAERSQQYLAYSTQLRQKFGLPKALLLVAPRALPTAVQREQLNQAAAETGYGQLQRTAVVVESALVRGAMVAISWLLGRPLRA